jgi:hypothetical protein
MWLLGEIETIIRESSIAAYEDETARVALARSISVVENLQAADDHNAFGTVRPSAITRPKQLK